MIGIYGIIENKVHPSTELRLNAFKNMSESVDHEDFNNQHFDSNHFSIGITRRDIGRNNDLSLRRIDNDITIAFCGYGKFRGERKLYWADEMIDRIAPYTHDDNNDILQQIEGSFQCLVIHKDVLTMTSDRFSSKNIFYYDGSDYFIFAPDISRILSTGLVPKEKNTDAAMQILVTGYFLDDSSLVKEIYRFPYASVMKKNIVTQAQAEFKRYWNMPDKEGRIERITPELIEDFAGKVDCAVNELAELEPRFIVPLSGGLDSRAVACFLYKKHKFTTVTYDTRDEISIAQQVCRKMGVKSIYFSDKMISTRDFSDRLFSIFREQKVHVVLNQYFYIPLFRSYFIENLNQRAAFSGIYLDELFSSGWPKYNFKTYDINRYISAYGGNSLNTTCSHLKVNKQQLVSVLEKTYNKILEDFGICDDLAKTQLFYVMGRLRRYVNESTVALENYCYVLKPGYNYDLLDFAWTLSPQIRHGVIYRRMLCQKFPDIMQVKYNDSYGNRNKEFTEKMYDLYAAFRKKLSVASGGIIKFVPYQLQYFFYKRTHMQEYERIFCENRLTEFIDDKEIKHLLRMVEKKYYFFEIYQRLLFLQQFYARHDFR